MSLKNLVDIDLLSRFLDKVKELISGKLDASLKGAAGGLAELDSSGKVPSSQLPSYVDDVAEYASQSAFPATGETGKIYVDTTANLTYRWSGSTYVEISPSLALGTTNSTAFRGDYGNAAYTHAVTNKGSAFASGLYKIMTNSEGHVTAATAVQKSDITALGIPGSNTTYTAATAAPGNVASASATGSSTNYARQDHTHGIALATGDSNGQVKIAGTNVTVKGFSSKANLASPVFTGTPQAPTADAGTNSLQIATTAFVQEAGYYKSGDVYQTSGLVNMLGATTNVDGGRISATIFLPKSLKNINQINVTYLSGRIFGINGYHVSASTNFVSTNGYTITTDIRGDYAVTIQLTADTDHSFSNFAGGQFCLLNARVIMELVNTNV